MLQKAEEVRTMTKRIGTGNRRQFGIGFVPSVLYDTLPDLIRQFRDDASDVEIVLSELITIEQTVALKEGRIDIGFGRLWFDDDGLTRRVLRQEKRAIAAPHGHRLGRMKRRLMLRYVVDIPLILYPNAPRPSYADQVLSFYRKSGLEPKVAIEVREL